MEDGVNEPATIAPALTEAQQKARAYYAANRERILARQKLYRERVKLTGNFWRKFNGFIAWLKRGKA